MMYIFFLLFFIHFYIFFPFLSLTFAEPSANLSFFDFWFAHHVFIDVLKCALHASDYHALYPIYTIDADDFIRL